MKQSITQKMSGRWKYLLFVCIFMMSALSGFADHFRYGNLTWERVPGNPLAVKFTIRNAFRLSVWTSQNIPVTVGSTIQSGNFKPGQGANIPIPYKVTAVNVKDDWWFGEYSVVKTYTAPGVYTAYYNNCCRIIPLQNNSNALVNVPTNVQVGTGYNNNNDAPVVIASPIVNFPRDKSLVSLKIPAIDPNGDSVTFSLTPNGQFGSPSVQPAGMSITTDGWLTWNTIGKTVGSFYNTSVTVTDSKGAYTTIDFLIKITDTSSTPSFDYVASPQDGSTFNMQPGQPIVFHIKVADPNTGDTVTLRAIGLPPGATFTTSGTNPVDGTFGWSPSPDQQGTYVVVFVSEDGAGVQNTTTVNFHIAYDPVFDVPTTPGNNSIFSFKPGDTVTHIISASIPDTGNRVILTAATGITSGMAFTPAFPLAIANPATTNFKWIPQNSDWGVKQVVYKAEDTFNHKTAFDTLHYVIDNPPVITSTPDTTVGVGQTYTYVLSATDLDIPLGDKLKVENITLPSFLSIVNNNNNTWTISGTPAAGDIGLHNITIELADSMNHQFGTHDGNDFQYIPLHVTTAPLGAAAVVTNATIFGTSTGAINLTTTGGVGPYTYSWSNSAATEDLGSIPAGTYIVTITDAANSTYTDTFTVTEPAQLTVSGTVSDATIYGNSNGSVDITPAGGVGPYTYSWNNNATSEDLSGVAAGTYMVTVTDANGATATGTYTVNQPAQLTATSTVNNATIYGNSNGSIDITPAGGVGPYTYSWSNNATTEDLSNIGAGTYTITITDANGATYTQTFTVTQPAQLTVSGTVSNATIYGSSNGSVDITPAGGVGPYTYSWNNNATSEDLSGVAAGTYMVTVTDANGATATGTYTVNQPAQLTATGTVNNATIYGNSNGSIDITPAGSVGPYTYSWSNNATTEDLSNVGAGTYSVTITDANGATYTQTFTITQPAQLTVSGIVTNVTTIGGNNGAIDITPAGGVGPYTYLWSNSAATEDLSNLTAGTYTVTVTDANGATASAAYSVAQPLVATIAVSPVYTISGHAPYTIYKGYGQQSVTLSASAMGGTPGYTYSWSPSAGLSSANTAVTTASPQSTTTYTLTVTDANNTTTTATQTVYVIDATCGNGNNNKVLVCHRTLSCNSNHNHNWNCYGYHNICISVNAVATHLAHGDYIGECFDVDGSVTNVSCNGSSTGAINLSVSGGAQPYTYSWSNNATTEDISGLATGNYSVTVTSADGRIITKSFNVAQPSPLNVNGTVSNACYNSNNGSINMSVCGGVSPYTYAWNDNATSQDRQNLAAGTYSVIITDYKGCTTTKTYTVTQPSAPLALSAALTNVSCNGAGNGAVDLNVSGGTGPYSYNWNLGNNNNNNNNNCWNWWWWWCNNNCNNNNNSASTQDVNGLDAGTYNVTVTDANGCTVTGSYTITEPAAISISASKTNVTCKGASNGTITLNVSGGTAPYSYNWGNNVTTQNLSNLAAGYYAVTITDAHGCTKSETVHITEPSNGVNVNANVTNVSCKGSSTGAVNLSVNGGNWPYTYSWTGGATSQDISNRPAGTYSVAVTDQNGCTVNKTYTITEPATALSISAAVSNVSCKGGSNGAIDLSVNGGSTPYTYNWNLGSNSNSSNNNNNNNNCWNNWWNWWCNNNNNNNCNNNNNNNTSNSQDVNGLDAGTYSVTVTDANGCSVTGSYTVTEPATALSVTGSTTAPTCTSPNSGTITIAANGGTSPYSYSWSNGSNWNNGYNNVTTQNRTGLSSGNYTVKVTDDNGCNETQTFSVGQPVSNISASISVSPMVTVTNGQPYTIYNGYGPQSVTLTANVSGGNNGYSFHWSPSTWCSNSNSASTAVSPNSATTYTVTITSNTGCTKTVSKTINVVDATCGTYFNPKVIVCHNGHEICVSENAVQTHLNHGCYVGPCTNGAKGESAEPEEKSNNDITALNVKQDIKVYPNPNNGIFTLELPAGTENANVLVTDLSGKVIMRKAATEGNILKFDLSNTAQGIYLIQVVAGNDRYQSRITIK